MSKYSYTKPFLECKYINVYIFTGTEQLFNIESRKIKKVG